MRCSFYRVVVYVFLFSYGTHPPFFSLVTPQRQGCRGCAAVSAYYRCPLSIETSTRPNCARLTPMSIGIWSSPIESQLSPLIITSWKLIHRYWTRHAHIRGLSFSVTQRLFDRKGNPYLGLDNGMIPCYHSHPMDMSLGVIRGLGELLITSDWRCVCLKWCSMRRLTSKRKDL